MATTLAERWRKDPWKQALDQFLHVVAIGAPPVAILLGFAEWGFAAWKVAGGSAAALWVSAVREFEQRPVNSWGDLVVDVVFCVLGGALAGACFL